MSPDELASLLYTDEFEASSLRSQLGGEPPKRKGQWIDSQDRIRGAQRVHLIHRVLKKPRREQKTEVYPASTEAGQGRRRSGRGACAYLSRLGLRYTCLLYTSPSPRD